MNCFTLQSKTQLIKSISKFTPGAERLRSYRTTDAVKHKAPVKNSRVSFLTQDTATLMSESQQPRSVRQEVENMLHFTLK